MMAPEGDEGDIRLDITTKIGAANEERVVVRGYDLAAELIGAVSYTEMTLLTITGRRPTRGEVRVADAVLVSFVDHGLQPSALAARMTYNVGPEALQGAVAAGLLGAGSAILGTIEECAHLLASMAADVEAGTPARSSADRRVNELLSAGRRIPGIGHALHRGGDPRAAKLLEVAAGEGIAICETEHLALVVEAAHTRMGRDLPPNAAGAAAALLLGIGIPWQLHRGFALISRTAGIIAHIGEEIDQPLTPEIRRVLRRASWLQG